jgi:hypothetical protein
MKQLTCATALLLGLGFVALDYGSRSDVVEAAGADEHAYFESLVRRSDVWKSYSLRDPAQVRMTRDGGHVQNGDEAVNAWVSYNPQADTDRNRQDAAKFIVPAFFAVTKLTAAVGTSDTALKVEYAYKSQWGVGKVMMVDREAMTVTGWLSDTSIAVKRGTYGTVPAAHSGGALVMKATNSLVSQLRVPLNTEDGHSYFITWDGYWTDSFVGAGKFNHKAFQLSSGHQDGNAIFFEPGTHFGDTNASCYNPAVHIASVNVRSYNKVGGVANWSLTDGDQLGPGVPRQNPLNEHGTFCLKANTWVRFFVNVRQRANDYDYVDMWVADETTEPLQVLVNVPISVRPTGGTPNSIQKFWVELNSSSDEYLRVDNRDLVVYVRNIVALRDTADVRPLLIRPAPGAQAVPGPAAPRNVRIISGS